MKILKNNKIKPYLFLAPATVFFIMFVIFPLFYTIYLSFFDWNMIRPTMKFVGLGNYINIFTDPNFYKIAKNTIVYMLIIAFTNCLIPYIFAFVCKFIMTKFKNFYKVTIFLPGFISLIVASTMFLWILCHC